MAVPAAALGAAYRAVITKHARWRHDFERLEVLVTLRRARLTPLQSNTGNDVTPAAT